MPLKAPNIALPPADTGRWVVKYKAQVVGAVQYGMMTLDDACARYNLSVEEFIAWQKKCESIKNWQQKYLFGAK